MGRDLYLYVLPKAIEHDTSKKFCFQFEFQDDEKNIISKVYERATGRSSKFNPIDENVVGYTSRKKQKEFNDDVHETAVKYMFRDEHKDDWCCKCSLFANGIFSCGLIIDKVHIHHAYSSPYWMSSWNIQDLYLGTSTSRFACLFRNDSSYREVRFEDVQMTYRQINELGKPLRESDIMAYDETLKVLKFLEKWTQQEHVIVIMDEQ